MKITAHALIDALDSVVWYNGLGETLRKWRHANPNNQESIMPYTMYLNNEIDVGDYNQLQVIWIICVVLFGDYGTSPRSGWIDDWDGFCEFIDKITTTYLEEEEEAEK